MDEGTDAKEILENKTYPLRRGWEQDTYKIFFLISYISSDNDDVCYLEKIESTLSSLIIYLHSFFFQVTLVLLIVVRKILMGVKILKLHRLQNGNFSFHIQHTGEPKFLI